MMAYYTKIFISFCLNEPKQNKIVDVFMTKREDEIVFP